MALQLITVLDPDYNPDYWSDVVISEAGDLLESLQLEDWSNIAAEARNKSPAWCVRLAEALRRMQNNSDAHALLKILLSRDELCVGNAAAEGLIETCYSWEPGVSLMADIDKHLIRNGSKHNVSPLKRLKSRLPR